MQLIHDTYAKQLVQLCETKTQRRWRRDKLVATEYQVLDTLLNYLENLPKDKLDLVVATFGPSIPQEYAEEMVGHIIDWGVPKDTWNDTDGRRWLGELMSELRIEQMHKTSTMCSTICSKWTNTVAPTKSVKVVGTKKNNKKFCAYLYKNSQK